MNVESRHLLTVPNLSTNLRVETACVVESQIFCQINLINSKRTVGDEFLATNARNCESSS